MDVIIMWLGVNGSWSDLACATCVYVAGTEKASRFDTEH